MLTASVQRGSPEWTPAASFFPIPGAAAPRGEGKRTLWCPFGLWMVTPVLAGGWKLSPDTPLNLSAPPSSQPQQPSVGGPLLSFLPFIPDCRAPEAPRPAPCRGKPGWEQLIPIQHSASPAQGILHSLVPMECDAFPTTASHGPVPARHFAASQLPRAGNGVSSTIFILSCYPIPGMLHPQGSHAAQHRGWRCVLRSHLHVLPRRA